MRFPHCLTNRVVLSGVAACLVVWMGWEASRAQELNEAPIIRFALAPPEKVSLGGIGMMALSPDGRYLAFVATPAGARPLLWLRPFEALDAHALEGTEGASYPFWSPDSRKIGFFAQAKLKTVEVSGGPPRTLCDAPNSRGGAWNRDDVIVFTPGAREALYRISARGGEPAPVTTLDASRQESSHRRPQFLPDGRHFLFANMAGRQPGAAGPGARAGDVARRQRPSPAAPPGAPVSPSADEEAGAGGPGMYVGSLDPQEPPHPLPVRAMVTYAAPGYLVFARGGRLVAVPFDSTRLEPTGQPFPITDPVPYAALTGGVDFTVSDHGILAYRSGGGDLNTQLAWFDRSGRRLGGLGEPAIYRGDVRLAPDEKRVAVGRLDPERGSTNIWLLDVSTGNATPFTNNASTNGAAVWAPDGKRVIFSSGREGVTNLFKKLLDGGPEEPLFRTESNKLLNQWSADGRYLVYQSASVSTAWDLWVLPLSGGGQAKPFAQTKYNECQGNLSPDGRWMAYASDESGEWEIYVQPFPEVPSRKKQVSSHGGTSPQWRRDGKELFYLSRDRKLMAVPVETRGGFKAGEPKPLFGAPTPAIITFYENVYAPSADGQRFLITTPVAQAPMPIIVVVNWTAEAQRHRGGKP